MLMLGKDMNSFSDTSTKTTASTKPLHLTIISCLSIKHICYIIYLALLKLESKL